MDDLALLVLEAVQARAQYNEALYDLAMEATGFNMLKPEVVEQIEKLAVDSHTSAADLVSVASLAQGNRH